MNKNNNSQADMLFRAICCIDSVEGCREFFRDLCTFKEIQDMSQRFAAAVLLSQGKSYSDIIADIGLSSATIGRVNNCLKYGDGGYSSVIEKMEGMEE